MHRRVLALSLAAVLLSAGRSSAGLLSVPEDYTPDRAWPVIVSLQDNPSPALTAKSPYFLVHAGGIGVECGAGIHKNLKDLVGQYRIDVNRIYGTGFSRGGHELLEQSWHYPHLFAAIAPVCNDLRSEPKVFYVRYLQTPTLLLHGDRDLFVRTGRRVFDLMQAANCPVEWGTYPGGHTPQTPFKQDLSLLTRFFEKHTFNPYPKEVRHVIVHPRYARALWVDAYLTADFLEKPTTQPAPRPPTSAAMQKPYVLREAGFRVTVKDGNRLEIEANDDIVALDLYLTRELVDLSTPVTVLDGEKTLYSGPAACPLKVVVRPGPELKAAHLKPLWEDLTAIQRQTRYLPLSRGAAASRPSSQAAAGGRNEQNSG
jgi:hypothetical protein